MNVPCLNGKNKLEAYEIGTVIHSTKAKARASAINKSMADGYVALHDAGIATSNVSVFTGYTRPNYLHTCDSPRYIL